MQKPTSDDDECYGVDDLDDTINEETQESLRNDQFDSFLLKDLEKMINQTDLENCNCVISEFINDPTVEIPITPEDQEKTIFTCPYRTFSYKRMPFELCNAPVSFQRCMIAIFHDMVEDFMEVFMDDFSVLGNSFDYCLANLDKMLARLEIEHKAYWALKQCNTDLAAADFKVRDKVLSFNSRFKMYPGKLISKWYGLNTVKTVYPYRAIEITDKNEFSFKVNGQQLKKYYSGSIDKEDNEVVEFEEDAT
ncbi:hypothetical protein Tco_1019369 [Tanacetum coccineum]|uniref:Reverse transcriptase domain-containing protein n=1 Tax=Tanacetum coccineum TaxID=301880 RepID=A0ABQ5FXG3_9ASTR